MRMGLYGELHGLRGCGGGAYGLFVAHSGSVTNTDGVSGTGSFFLGATFYCDAGAMLLSGTVMGTSDLKASSLISDVIITSSLATYINSDSNGVFKVQYTKVGATDPETDNFSINFDDGSQNFIRKKINTNPTLLTPGS